MLPKLRREVLNSLQIEFLKQFFAGSFGPHFFLTGGTALAGFYFGHRLSEDLDLFTMRDEALPAADALIPHIAEGLDCTIVNKREAEYFRQFVMESTSKQAQFLRVDLVRDFGPQYGEHATVEGITVDSMVNIGANKLTAILGRTDAKDFVDLHFILDAGLDFNDLFLFDKEKDTGLNEFYLAQAMREVRRLSRLPSMQAPLQLGNLQEQFVALANQLLDRINPQDYSLG